MIGVDIIEIRRMEKAAQSKPFFLNVFTKNERSYYLENGKKAETLAGMFAAKEAAVKALGIGLTKQRLAEIEVGRDGAKPVYNFYGQTAKLFEKYDAHLSVSHDGGYAIACTILEQKNANTDSEPSSSTATKEKAEVLFQNIESLKFL